MKHVFGPVLSRQLGNILKVDPVPYKACNWDCVYCQLGATRVLVDEPREYSPARDIVGELEFALAHLGLEKLDHIVLEGSGETLLYADTGELIQKIKLLTDVPLAVVTNGSLLIRDEVRRPILDADIILPSFDAAHTELFERINRPHFSCSYNKQLEGLCLLREEYGGKLWVEVMLIRGVNDTEEALKDLEAIFEMIEPDEIHLKLPHRPVSEAWVRPPTEEGIMRAVSILGHASKVIHPTEGEKLCSSFESVDRGILKAVRRHPMTHVELDRTLTRWAPGTVGTALYDLEKRGELKEIERYGTTFWCDANSGFAEKRAHGDLVGVL
ncbi:radical SAM domain protein [Verrucomicrobiia bacterium DG1235]|nr:radical SAM domain protein [Verrucomicrobiae bacterium DG1235]